MVIFIDESGNFSNPQGKPNVVSCVGALSVPETCIDDLFIKFSALKAKWNVGEEIKGSQLTERQASELINLCKQYDIVLKVVATDMGLVKSGAVKLHKEGQAEKLRNSAKGAHPNMEKELNALADRIVSLSDQLYAQSLLMTLLLDGVFRETTLYYCQRDAQCLGNFAWMIDAKDKSLTEYERLWKTICMPFLQTMSVEKPLIQIREGDYSAFKKYHREKERPPEYLAKHMKPEKGDEPFRFIDIKELLSSLTFSDSKKELGLQLADLLTTTIRRSLSLTLQIEGWRDAGNLMLRVPKGDYAVRFVGIGGGDDRMTTPYGKILVHFDKTARSPFK